jgi:hypothetical protein
MPKKEYYLDSDKTERLDTEWKGYYKNFRVVYNGNEILQFENKKALVNGGEYKIDENRLLSVRLVKKKLTGVENLEILINSEPIKGSSTDPFEIVKGVWVLLYVLAGLNFILGLISELFSIEFLLNLGMGIGTIIVGLIYGLLGLLIKTKNSMIALIISILLLSADLILSIVYITSSSGYIVKLFFIIMLSRGIGALKQIKKMEFKKSDIN